METTPERTPKRGDRFLHRRFRDTNRQPVECVITQVRHNAPGIKGSVKYRVGGPNGTLYVSDLDGFEQDRVLSWL